jgi:formylglycine-generating enzyme required for sulfatase activity
MPAQPTIDPDWWEHAIFEGRPLRDYLRARDVGAIFRFLGSRGWSRAAIAAATGLTENRVRAVARGTQQISSCDVLERVSDGLKIDRGMMGLAFTEDIVQQTPDPQPVDGVLTRVTHPGDKREMVRVEEGAFLHGEAKTIMWLPSYYIDLHPVTNADYEVFVAATKHRCPPHWTDDGPPSDLDEHPVVNVSHRDAAAYAEWAGKRLPSELEWEKAARGPKGYIFPWGDQRTPAKCNVRESGVGHTTPVGLYRSGASPYGVFDMSGNVWEWCLTETSPGRFVLKGSAFSSPFEFAVASAMNDAAADMYDDDTGFRCACLLEEVSH